MAMSEAEIRKALVDHLQGRGRVVEEVGICDHQARIDVSLFNDDWHGYEIKSTADTLKRLPSQLELYARVCGTVTVVCAPKHLVGVRKLVPDWVGVVLAYVDDNRVRFHQDLPALPNPNPRLEHIARSLWCAELQALLTKLAVRGRSAMTRPEMAQALVKAMSEGEVMATAMNLFRKRDWGRMEAVS
jgi:hypothetical protein